MATKAIIFDCFGVLTTDGWKQIREDELTSLEAKQEAEYLDRAVNTGTMSYDTFVKRIAELRGATVQATRAQLVDTAANARLFEYIRDYLKPSYKIGLLSNAADNWLKDLFTPWQLALFDEVVLSYDVGMVKPDPNIYALIAAKLEVLPEECLFIDDIERFTTAAIEAGMQATVFTDTDTFIKDIEKRAL